VNISLLQVNVSTKIFVFAVVEAQLTCFLNSKIYPAFFTSIPLQISISLFSTTKAGTRKLVLD